MNGKLIPGDEVGKLPIGTKVLVCCLDDPDDEMCVCIIQRPKNRKDEMLFLYEPSTDSYLTEVDNLDAFCKVYEFDEEDAKMLVKDRTREDGAIQVTTPRYVFDKDEMTILDTRKNQIVCWVDAKRQDLLDAKVMEMLGLANAAECTQMIKGTINHMGKPLEVSITIEGGEIVIIWPKGVDNTNWDHAVGFRNI